MRAFTSRHIHINILKHTQIKNDNEKLTCEIAGSFLISITTKKKKRKKNPDLKYHTKSWGYKKLLSTMKVSIKYAQKIRFIISRMVFLLNTTYMKLN